MLITLDWTCARGATITWTNTAGGSWSAANNWSPNQVPAAADTALITASGDYAVTLSAGAQVAALTVGGSSGSQNLSLLNSTLSVSSGGTVNANGVLSLNDSTWGGALSVAGTLNWTNEVTLANGGVVTILSNAILNISGGNGTSLELNGVLTNGGTVNWSGSGDIYMENYPSSGETGGIVNLPGSAFNIQNDEAIYGEGAAYFDNEGTLTKSAGINTTMELVLTNSGVLNIASGTLTLNNGGLDTGTTPGAGSVIVAGGTLVLNGSMGNLAIAGGTVTGVNASIGILTLSNGTLQGTSTVTGSATWTGGALGNESSLTVASNVVLNLTTTSANPTVYLYGVLTNAGTVNWSGNANIYVDNYSNQGETGGIVNLPGAAFNLQNDQTMYAEGAAYFDNAGTLTKSAGINTTMAPVLTNSGVVNVASGTLTLDNGGLYAGTSTGAGSVTVASGTLLLNGSIGNLAIAGGTVTGVNASIGILTLSNGTLQGASTVTGSATWTGGALGNESSLTVASNVVLNLTTTSANPTVYLYGVLTNAGTVNWSGNANIYVNNYSNQGETGGIVNLPGAVFNIQNDQTVYAEGAAYFDNAGTFIKSAGINTVMDLVFTNSGVVNLASGTLTLNGGGLYAGTSTGAGSVTVPNGTLVLEGMLGNLIITGGTVTGVNAGIGNLTWSSGTLQGAATVTGSGTWLGGSLNNGASLTVAPSAVLNLMTGGASPAMYFYGVLTNAGTVNWSGNGNIYLYNYSSSGETGGMVNLTGAVFNIQNDETLYGYGSAYINNAGTIVKSAGTNTTIGAALNNTGILNLNIYSASSFGRINFPYNLVLSGGLRVNFAPSYSPSTGDSFPLLNYNSESGTFSSVGAPPPTPWETNSVTYGSTAFTFSVGSLYNLVFAPGPAATNVAGAIFAPVVVQAKQLDGSPFPTNGAPLTITLTGGSGPLNGTVTQLTDATGKAVFTNLSINLVGAKALEVASPPWVTPAASSTTIIPATPKQLSLVKPIAYWQEEGYPFSPTPTVKVMDQYGNTAVNATVAVTAQSISSGSGELRGTTQVNANGTNGLAVFAGLYYNLGDPEESETVTPYFTSPGLTAATNAPVLVEFSDGTIVLTNGNSSLLLNPNSQDGMLSWKVDGTDQLYQHWFWLRQDPGLAQVSLDQLASPLGVITTSSNAILNYFPRGLGITLSCALSGGAAGSHASTVVETFSILNTNTNTVSLHLYDYTDFDLGGEATNDTLSFPATNTAVQEGKGFIATQTITGPPANEWAGGWYALILDEIDSTNAVVLADTINPNEAGDQTFAYQWDFTLGAGQTFVLNETNTIEPAQVMLTIAKSGTNVIVSWPSKRGAGFTLQAGALQPAGSWVSIPTAPTVGESNYQMMAPINSSAQFYRLQK